MANMNICESAVVVFVDFEKEFDMDIMINHQTLLYQMERAIFGHRAQAFMMYYLCKRKQFIRIEGMEALLNAGVTLSQS